MSLDINVSKTGVRRAGRLVFENSGTKTSDLRSSHGALIQDSIFSSACQECDEGFVGISCKYKNCEEDPDKCLNGGICHDRSPDKWLSDVDPAYCQCPDPLYTGLGSFF